MVKFKLKENWRFFSLLILAIIFFFIYSYLPLTAPAKFNSPDETANFLFSKIFISDSLPRIYEPLNRQVDNIIHPRSINISGDYLVPGSFLGLILIYGLVGKLFGLGTIFFIAPFLAVIAVLFFYQLIKKVFGVSVSYFSSLLLLVHPAWWYYASKNFVSNVLFISFLIIGLTFLITKAKKNELTFAVSGLLIGLALIVRTSEIVWVGALFLSLAVIYRKDLSWKKVFIFLFFLGLIILPVLYYNQQIYQSPFSSGYSQLQQKLPQPRFLISRAQIKYFFFPFEVVPDNFMANFYKYFVYFFSSYFILFILGAALFLIKFKKNSSERKIYFTLFILISLYLVIYYGSWNFHDNLDPNKITIGTSYVRYFLPIYIFSLPFVSLIFLAILGIFKRRYLKIIVGLLSGLFFIGYSANLVFSNDEGLVKISHNLRQYKEKSIIIENLTEPDAVVVADRNDKIVFPERRVVSCLIADCPKFKSLDRLIELIPVYYYPSSPNFKAEEFNQKILAKYGMEIDEGKVIKDWEKIYRFRVRN